jgi:hypothetical protein
MNIKADELCKTDFGEHVTTLASTIQFCKTREVE